MKGIPSPCALGYIPMAAITPWPTGKITEKLQLSPDYYILLEFHKGQDS
jgi:hypothetical protein